MTDDDSERIRNLESLIVELAASLRELHDFGVVDTHYRYAGRSQKAFDDAEKLLEKLGY